MNQRRQIISIYRDDEADDEEKLLQAGDSRVRARHHLDHPLPRGGAGRRGLVCPLSHGGVGRYVKTQRTLFAQGKCI